MEAWIQAIALKLTSLYFDDGKKPEYPQLEPHARTKMAQVLGSPVYICDENSCKMKPYFVWGSASGITHCLVCGVGAAIYEAFNMFRLYPVTTKD